MHTGADSIGKSQVEAYERLSCALHAHDKQVLEIEILPPAIQPPDGLLIQDGLSLGIPKKVLALAFIEARKQFFQNASHEGFRGMALLATKVMLLFDSEHLAAANYRKRRLKTLKAGDTPQAQIAYRKAVQFEFCFLDTILTSPLHRQSKSPTLWHHRFWLLDLLSPDGLKNVPLERRTMFWRTELDAVCKSAERHPKNYYAWQYARKLNDWVDGQEATFDFAHRAKHWCCQHPSDISGWSFLLHLLSELEPVFERQAVVQDVVNFAFKWQFEHESLWVFIRTVLAHDTLPARVKLISTLRDYTRDHEAIDNASPFTQRVIKSLEWIETYGEPALC
jgi:hypothetical protein